MDGEMVAAEAALPSPTGRDPERGARLAPLAAPACSAAPAAVPLPGGSHVLRHNGAGWDGVRPQVVGLEAAAGMTRRVLAAPAEASFEVRYLELDAGGASTLQRDAQARVVVCQRGRGRIRLGERVHELGYGDVVQVAAGEPFQYLNPYAEPFGFLCILDRGLEPAGELEG